MQIATEFSIVSCSLFEANHSAEHISNASIFSSVPLLTSCIICMRKRCTAVVTRKSNSSNIKCGFINGCFLFGTQMTHCR